MRAGPSTSASPPPGGVGGNGWLDRAALRPQGKPSIEMEGQGARGMGTSTTSAGWADDVADLGWVAVAGVE